MSGGCTLRQGPQLPVRSAVERTQRVGAALPKRHSSCPCRTTYAAERAAKREHKAAWSASAGEPVRVGHALVGGCVRLACVCLWAHVACWCRCYTPRPLAVPPPTQLSVQQSTIARWTRRQQVRTCAWTIECLVGGGGGAGAGGGAAASALQQHIVCALVPSGASTRCVVSSQLTP